MPGRRAAITARPDAAQDQPWARWIHGGLLCRRYQSIKQERGECCHEQREHQRQESGPAQCLHARALQLVRRLGEHFPATNRGKDETEARQAGQPASSTNAASGQGRQRRPAGREAGPLLRRPRAPAAVECGSARCGRPRLSPRSSRCRRLSRRCVGTLDAGLTCLTGLCLVLPAIGGGKCSPRRRTSWSRLACRHCAGPLS